MDFGLPYDSDAGRAFAATVTAILCGDAYAQSARIAESCPPLGAATPLTQGANRDGGACPGFYVNREPFLDVIRMHRAEVNNIDKRLKPPRHDALHRSAARRAQGRRADCLGRSPRPRRAVTATATRRSPSSRPPAPSAS